MAREFAKRPPVVGRLYRDGEAIVAERGRFRLSWTPTRLAPGRNLGHNGDLYVSMVAGGGRWALIEQGKGLTSFEFLGIANAVLSSLREPTATRVRQAFRYHTGRESAPLLSPILKPSEEGRKPRRPRG